MKNKKEFLELKNVSDYWKKLLWEFDNLKNKPNNVYFAFNFIVTAWHLTDWYFREKHPNDDDQSLKLKIKNFVEENPVVEISEHLANGAKHFEITFKKHKSVKSAVKERYVEEGYWEKGYSEDPIIVYINEDFKSEFGKSIKLDYYSKKLMEFWLNQLTDEQLI